MERCCSCGIEYFRVFEAESVELKETSRRFSNADYVHIIAEGLGLDLLSCAYCISTRVWQSRKVENKLFIYTKVGEYINGVDINRRPVC
ncbi:hypothetical protein L2E82_30589 [Cichorium intybus]|uniref:Uncharacterized protein n=1 Tax=Cichorium intybus TaxID=13427 RepID=A0ACB9D0P8_CICIN|nr:hypothetical protein L2E82_30589 [Cichorium intybus]